MPEVTRWQGHVVAILRSSNFRSSLGNHEYDRTIGVIRLLCDVSMFGIGRRKRNSSRPPSTIHSGNPPAPVFRLVVPRCRIGSRIPTTSLPSAVSCGGFPSTRNFDRLGRRQCRMICAVKDGAWLIQSLSIAGLDWPGTFEASAVMRTREIPTGIADNA
jgi:hypothetical protein